MESFLLVAVVIGNGTASVFLEGLLTLSNVHDKVKTLEIIESRLFSCISIPDKFLV